MKKSSENKKDTIWLISLMTQEKKWFYDTYKTQIHIPSSPHIKLKINFIFYIIWSWKNEFNYSFSMNKQIDWHRFHIRYKNERKEKEITECEKMNKQIDWHRFHIQYENEGKEKK